MVAKKQIAPELLTEAKRLYEQTLAPVDDIAGMLGISRTPFYRIVRSEGWRNRRARVATFQFAKALGGSAVLIASPAEQPRAMVVAVDPLPPQQRLVLAESLMTATTEALDAIKRVTAQIQPANPIEAEANARSMASISRSLREIAILIKPDEVTPPNEADDDPVPRDIDEFRYELARRIRGFIESRRLGAGGVSAQSEDTLD
ncbi:MAG TPA: hypothetical protein VGM57_18575 [Pseudolabrys sp.]|jgi:hypothetical protein